MLAVMSTKKGAGLVSTNGEAIGALLKARGWNRKRLAAELSRTEMHVSNLMRGGPVALASAKHLALLLGTELAAITCDEPAVQAA